MKSMTKINSNIIYTTIHRVRNKIRLKILYLLIANVVNLL